MVTKFVKAFADAGYSAINALNGAVENDKQKSRVDADYGFFVPLAFSTAFLNSWKSGCVG